MKPAMKTIILLLCLALLSNMYIAQADTILDDDPGNYQFIRVRDLLAVVGYIGKQTELTFPTELDGKKVIQIGSGTDDRKFSYSNFVEITIPEGVEEIADYAFSGCESLRIVEIAGSVKQTAPPETLFAGLEYKHLIIKTLRGSAADEYAQKYHIPVWFTGDMTAPVPAITVPVYYLDEHSVIVAQETQTLMQSSVVTADTSLIPSGYSLLDGSSVFVTVTDSAAVPNPVIFRLKNPPVLISGIAISKDHFPDDAFRGYVSENLIQIMMARSTMKNCTVLTLLRHCPHPAVISRGLNTLLSLPHLSVLQKS